MATQLKKRKHNLRKQNFKQGKVDKRRFEKYNESIKGVDSIANRANFKRYNDWSRV